MWDMIKNWMKENQKKEQERYRGVADFVNRRQGEPTAHDNIDNLINIETLNRISHSSDMFGNQALYQAQTKGGDKRHILQNFGGETGKQDLELIDYLLREQIRENPTFSDTLTTEELPGVKKTMAQAGNPFKNILRMIMGK